jgi:hypothetical protein
VLATAAAGARQDVGERRLESLKVELPLTDSSICSAAGQWSIASKTLVGVECFWESARPERRPAADRVVHELNLSGMSAPESLNMLIAQLPTYEARIDGKIAVLRPKTAGGASASMLDRAVPRFELRDASLVEALVAVNQLYDPGYQIAGPAATGPRTMNGVRATSDRARGLIQAAIERYNDRFVKSITVNLRNTTVEKILSEIALQSGQSWRVMYVRPTKQYQDSTIDFLTVGEPLRSGPARVRRVALPK